MHPRVLRTFLAVARHRNVTRAAEEVHLAQSSVSDQLQALEAELDAVLFVRGRQGLRLTAAGEALAAHAQGILQRVDEAKAAVAVAAGQQNGTIALGTLETIAATRLAPWLASFRQAHPQTTLAVQVMGTGELLRALGSGGLDAVFCFDRGVHDPRLASREVAREPLVLIAAPDTAPAEGIDPAGTAASARFVVTAKGCVYRQVFDAAFARAGITAPVPIAEVDSIRTIARMVAGGAGMSLVPRLAVADELARGELVEVAWPDAGASASLLLLWRKQRTLAPALTHLLDHVDATSGLTPVDDRPRRAAPCLS